MTIAVSLTEEAVNTALGNFLTAVVPSTVEIVVGEVNRVAEPQSPDFVVMWPLRRPRLATNIDTSADAKFTGSITGTVMTITEVVTGKMNVGAVVFGIGVAANTTVSVQLTGTPGGAGTYAVAPAQTVASETLSAGQKNIRQPTEAVYQIDVHGPNSSDNSQIIATLFRDAFGVQKMAGSGVTPLYAEDPKQIPFRNGADQIEIRWVIELHMQISPFLLVPAQYADQATVTLIDVPETLQA
jgi:hypothetical protein